MGYIAHHAAIITGDGGHGDEPSEWIGALTRLREEIAHEGNPALSERFDRLLVGPVHSVTNGDVSFAFLPDGSKEGWPTSDTGDRIRALLVEFARSHLLQYVVVRFGGDDYDLADVEAHDGDDYEESR